jgi:hypothetical protein
MLRGSSLRPIWGRAALANCRAERRVSERASALDSSDRAGTSMLCGWFRKSRVRISAPSLVGRI